MKTRLFFLILLISNINFLMAQIQDANKLVIHGKDIWVRDVPSTGKVIMKLNEGNSCELIEKGSFQLIKGTPDFWYKIRFEGKEGWVFGSQTNLKTKPENSLTSFYNELAKSVGLKEIQKESDVAFHVEIVKNQGSFYLLVFDLQLGDPSEVTFVAVGLMGEKISQLTFSGIFQWQKDNKKYFLKGNTICFSVGKWTYVNGNQTLNATERCIEMDQQGNLKEINQKTENNETGTFSDPRDGKIYKTIQIGAQTWFAENLAFKPDKGNYWAYDNNSGNVSKYGYLYDWETAKKVCPVGWHLPGDEEWTVLTDYLGGNNVAGGILKEPDTIRWKSPNTNADNSSRFSALPGGYRYFDYGSFINQRICCLWWSSGESSVTGAWSRYLGYDEPSVRRVGNNRKDGFSVRCIRDN